MEGNVYFPPESVCHEHLHPSETHTVCGWKGPASYLKVEAGGNLRRDAAWTHPEPKEAARRIAGFVAFRRGVEVTR